MSARTVAGLLRERAATRGAELAIRFKDGDGWEEWTHARFWDEAQRAAAALAREGIRPGDRVLLLVPGVKAAVRCLFGLWALGATPIPVGLPFRLTDVARFLDHLRSTAQQLRAAAIVVGRQLAAFAGDGGEIRALVAEDLAADPAGSLPDPDEAAAPALIQLTSGSTGRPRGVVLAHERLLLHLRLMSEALPSHARSVAVSWLPLHHDMGLVGGLLFPFYNGFVASMLSPEDFRARPMAWSRRCPRSGRPSAPPRRRPTRW
jgi:fatty-acyl-CoA synthase